jgi:hypothetical protein
MDDEKLLGLMRFWLFGTCVIVFAAITAYLRLITDSMAEILRAGLPIWGITIVAAVAIYYGYKWYLKRS